MSEVKSAREVATDIYKIPAMDDSEDQWILTYADKAAPLILSDRRAIIEKCKEAIHEEAKLYSPNVAKFDYSYCWAILDSAFAEIEVGK
jgi:hypothetical protein